MKTFINNHRLAAFIVISFLISWGSWLFIVDGIKPNLFESGANTLLIFFLGAYGPSITAMLLTAYLDGTANLKKLLKRIVLWRVGFSGNLMALLAGPVLYGLAVAAYAVNGGILGETNQGLLPWIPVVFLVCVFFGPLAEELGWRGFVLPLFDTKHKFVASSVIVGFIWALWHAPLFWAPAGTAISGFDVSAELIALFFLALIGSSFIYTWLFNKTSGSVFIAILLHLSMNASGTITAMFFPQMTLEQRFDMYQVYVVVVWSIVFAAAAIHHLKNSRPAKARLVNIH